MRREGFPPVGARLGTELRLGDMREEELPWTGRPERPQEIRRVGERIGVGAMGDDMRSRGGSDRQATADGGQKLDSSQPDTVFLFGFGVWAQAKMLTSWPNLPKHKSKI
jgi:hypothetical protein